MSVQEEVVMDFDDRIITMRMKFKYWKKQYLFRIFRKTSHVMIFWKHFPLLDLSKYVRANWTCYWNDDCSRRMNDPEVRKFGFIKIGWLAKEMVEQRLLMKMKKQRQKPFQNIMVKTNEVSRKISLTFLSIRSTYEFFKFRGSCSTCSTTDS